MVHVADYRADMAWGVLQSARDNNDADVAVVCIRVRDAWRLGRKVAREDLELIEDFSAS